MGLNPTKIGGNGQTGFIPTTKNSNYSGIPRQSNRGFADAYLGSGHSSIPEAPLPLLKSNSIL